MAIIKCLQYNNFDDADNRNVAEAKSRGCGSGFTTRWWRKRTNNDNTKFVLEVNDDTLNEGEVVVNIDFVDAEWNY